MPNWIVQDAAPGQVPAAWRDRYPEGANGYGIWMSAPLDQLDTPDAWRTWLSTLQQEWQHRRAVAVAPCVFVSHKQQDYALGLRAAFLAGLEGYDYWLDILDPNLQQLVGAAGSLPPEIAAVAMAACIEMGLLNSTHVLAIVTPDALSSRWVPYEFGRAKAPTVFSLQAAAYAKNVTSTDLGRVEYLYLCPVLQRDGVVTGDAKVSAWLATPTSPLANLPRPRRGVPPPRPPLLQPDEPWPPARLQ